MAPNALASRAWDPMGKDGSGRPGRRAPTQRTDPCGPDAAHKAGRSARTRWRWRRSSFGKAGRSSAVRPTGARKGPGPEFIRREAWDPAEDRRSSGGGRPHGPRRIRPRPPHRSDLRVKALLATRGKQPTRKRWLADTGVLDAAPAAAEREGPRLPRRVLGASARLARRTDVARPRSAGRGDRTGSNRQSCQGPSGPRDCHPLAWASLDCPQPQASGGLDSADPLVNCHRCR